MCRLWTIAAIVGSLCCTAVGADPWSDHPLNTWVKHSPRPDVPAPGLKYEGSGAMDPARRSWIHFGGHDGIPQGFYLFTCDMASGAWQQRFPNTSPPGVCCIDGSNTFDLAQQRFVAFPGGSLGHGYQWSRSVKLKESNVWLYDPAANHWTDMRPPPYKRPEKYSKEIIGRLNSSAAYDANHEVSIAFGGQGSGGPTNALWVYDAYANRLEMLKPPESPSPRDGSGLCYDTRHDQLVMFGSQYSDDERTWLYRFDSNRWEAHALDPHPPGRKEGTYATNPKLAHDSANGVCLCVVRRDKDSGLPVGTLETWVLDVGALRWTKMTPAASPDPSASRARNLSYWAEANLFVLETVAAEKGGPQIWTYRYQTPPAEHGPPPTALQVSTEPGKARLAWQPPSNKPSGYVVYRSQDRRLSVRERAAFRGANGDTAEPIGDEAWKTRFEKLAQTSQPVFEDNQASAEVTSFYRVSAIDASGNEGVPSVTVRTQPRVMGPPVVSVLEANRIEVNWTAHPAADVVGYNVYRGAVWVDTVLKGEPTAWRDNDPEYPEPVVVAVRDITDIKRLNEQPLKETSWLDSTVNLTDKGEPSGDYKFAVYAYLVRAVNRLGSESGPSAYALTIPADPQHVLLREDGKTAEIKWQLSPERGVVGYHVYKLGKSHWHIERVTEEPICEPTFRHQAGSGSTRYWVVPFDRLGQLGQPSSPVWFNHSYPGFFAGEWHQ